MSIFCASSRDSILIYKDEITHLLLENLRLNLPDEKWSMDEASNQLDNMLTNVDKKTAFLFLSVDKCKLSGFAWVYGRQVGKRQRFHINHFVVKSSERGKGVGGRLIEAIIAKAKEMKISAIDLVATKTRRDVIRFYLQNGFDIERYQMVYKLPKSTPHRNK